MTAPTAGLAPPRAMAVVREARDLGGMSDVEREGDDRLRREEGESNVVRLGREDPLFFSASGVLHGVRSSGPRARTSPNVLEAKETLRRSLYRERAPLVQAEVAKGGIDERQRRRLRYIDWQIDQLESERMADALSTLARIAEREEKFALQLDRVARLAESWKNPSTGKPGRR